MTTASAPVTRVYAWDGNAWVQRGSDIDGENAADNFGTAVSLSNDGTTVALGATRQQRQQLRLHRIFDGWQLLGATRQ